MARHTHTHTHTHTHAHAHTPLHAHTHTHTQYISHISQTVLTLSRKCAPFIAQVKPVGLCSFNFTVLWHRTVKFF